MRWLAIVLLPVVALPVRAQSEQLLVLTGRRPALLEMQIVLNGKPYAQAWEAYLDRLFHDLDLNGDGWLSRTEAARAPSAEFVTAFLHGSLNLEAAAVAIPFEQLDTSGAGKVSRAEFGLYYRRTGLSQARLTVGPEREQSLAMTNALFHLLGRGTERIASEDLKSAREILHRVDLNDDEWITPDEILLHGPEKPRVARPRPTLISLGLLPFKEAMSGNELASLRSRVPRWQGPEVGAPVARVAVRLGARQGGEPILERIGGEAACTRLDADGVRLRLDDVELDLRLGSGTVSRALGMHAFYRQQFQAADSGRQGSLDAKQVEDFPALAALFRLADRDGDGRLTTKEFETFLNLHAEGLQSFVTLTASDQTPGLFELLDENSDGRLSLRELHTAGRRLGSLIHSKDGSFERKDLPRRLELQASRGGPTPPKAKSGSPSAERIVSRGPAWFRRMDRNGDGYVSRREFLGSLDDFKKLDLDGDGLISPEEAEKFKVAPHHWGTGFLIDGA